MRRALTVIFLSLTAGCSAAGHASDVGSAGAGGGGGDASVGPGSTGALASVGSGGGSSCAHSTLTTYAPGPDGKLGTADDTWDGAQQIDFMPGPDDVAYAAHPVAILELDVNMMPSLYEKWTYDMKGIRQAITQYGPGPDGQYATGDDPIVSINQYTSDASGLLQNDIFHIDPGANGTWGDADDTVNASIVFEHEGGHVTWALPGTMPGPDGLWGTADDFFQASMRLEYDANGRLENDFISASSGPDGVFGTPDDVVTSRIAFPCRGDRVVQEIYSDPGPDGKWGTADDVMSARVIESGDECLSASCGVIPPF